MRILGLLLSHGVMLAVGFGLGVYILPILTAPESPDAQMLEDQSKGARYSVDLTRDLRGSDFLHWGEGKISLSPGMIVHMGKLSPGPDYKVYLVRDFVEHEDEFLPLKSEAAYIGDVKTFEGFLLAVPEGIDIEGYTTVLVWCEAFGEFITSAKYR